MTSAGIEAAEPMDATTKPRTGPLARMQRYRAKHRRIDYVPSQEALAIIEAWLSKGPSNCTAGVLDKLVDAGHKAISGNALPRR